MRRSMWSGLLLLLSCVPVTGATEDKKQGLDRQFQTAVAHYEASRFAEAALQLEKLVHDAPESFEVQELSGLVYSAQSQDAKANPHLPKAVRLKPSDAPGRTNLAANLSRLGKLELAEEQFKKAVEIAPANFDTNHNLGEA